MARTRDEVPSRGVVARLAENFAGFMHAETSGAIVLLIAAVIALLIANSAYHLAYQEFLHTEIGAFFGEFHFEQSLQHWIDDALMALFFFVVGLEIKREFLVGELSSFRKAALPGLAAVGGMVVPALVFLAFNLGGDGQRGWGIPMATDIAFALGILALLGSRIPDALKIFLAALAIADDIGSILVIAIFYTEQIAWNWLLLAVIPLAVMILMNRAGVDEPLWYLAVAAILWFFILNSGIHATIAGVIAAFAIPATARLTPGEFVDTCHLKLDEIEALDVPGAHTLEDDRQQKLALELRRAATLSTAPLQRLEFALHPITAFVVLPLFALANANIRLVGEPVAVGSVAAGIAAGLVIGKPVGIAAAAWLAVKLGVADLPSGVRWSHVVGAGMLGGIGFTMSLFVANLAFPASEHIIEAKLAILVASVIAGAVGWSWLRFVAPPAQS